MIILRVKFIQICFLSFVAVIVQYLFLNGFYDEGNYLFSSFGDDYNYINNFRYINNDSVKLIGLAVLGQITPYNYFLYLLINDFSIYFFWFVEIILFFFSNYYFYIIARTCLSKKYSNIALALFLVLPLRYIWLFSFYKDSILLSLSIIFVYKFYFQKNLGKLFYAAPVFLLRPFAAILIIIAGQLDKISLKRFLLLIISLFCFYYVITDYLYFFSSARLDIISDKLNTLPLNSNGNLTFFYLPFLWVFTVIQPTFRLLNDPDIWSNIHPVVQVESIIKFCLVPLIIQGIVDIRSYLYDKNIRLILFLLISFPSNYNWFSVFNK